MKKIKILQLGIAAILLLCVVFCQAQRQQDTVRVLILYTDTTYKGVSIPTKSTFVLSVRELHNTSEGVIDAGGQMCIDNMGRVVSCWHDYWKHIFYLSENKKPINKNWIVWQSATLK